MSQFQGTRRFRIDCGKGSGNTTRLFKMKSHRRCEYSVDVYGNPLDAYSNLATLLANRSAIIVTTPTVASLYGDDIASAVNGTPVCVIDVKERNKDIESVRKVCQWALDHEIERDGVLVAFGGGVVSDVVTIAASWIRRGIQHIRVPTSLVGQIDAGIGIKGAVNFGKRKGYLGCFYPPDAVLICPRLLQTLDERHIRCGMAEIIKMAIIADPSLFHKIQQHGRELQASRFQSPASEALSVISDSIVKMLEELADNLYEDQTYQRAVDFGHTFSPLVESDRDFGIPHGEAVAIDIALSSFISYQLVWIDQETRNSIVDLIRDLGLPCWSDTLTVASCRKALNHATRHRGGNPNLVVPTGIGETKFITDVSILTDQVIGDALTDLRRYAKTNSEPTAGRIRTGGPTSPTSKHLVLDVGGTSIRTAVYDASTNSISNQAHCATPNYALHPNESFPQLRDRMLADVLTTANKSLGGAAPTIVSMAFAGPLDEQGNVFAAPTVWGQKLNEPFDLRAHLEKFWPDTEITVVNDVAAAGYRFLRTPDDDLVVITVGSGIGNKTFLNGQPRTGRHGRGGEIGHIQVDTSDDAVKCECGGRGHLGGIASGRGAINTARRSAENDREAFLQSSPGQACGGVPEYLTNEQLVAGFHSGDGWSCSVIWKIAQPLARVIATIHLNLGIERFVIYGGFGLALGPSYRDLLVEAATKASWNVGQDWNSMIELGATDGDSGLIGAGRAAIFRSAKNQRQNA